MAQQGDQRVACYPSTETSRVIDTIGVLHPCCITPEHAAVASDRFDGFAFKQNPAHDWCA